MLVLQLSVIDQVRVCIIEEGTRQTKNSGAYNMRFKNINTHYVNFLKD